MASNPMQRKARISFLLGMFVTLLVTGAIIGFLFWQLTLKNEEEKKNKAAQVQICVLNADVKSGQVITSNLLETKTVNKDLVPSNATTNATTIVEDCALRDKEGNDITSRTDKNGELKKYITQEGTEYEIQAEEATNNYYITKGGQKTYIELDTVPVVAKVDMNKNTVITPEMINKEDSQVTNDMRKQEYNMLVLPMDLETNDYVDIRLMLPTGQDYIVISRKQVEVPDISGTPSADTVKINMSEDETLTMSSAIVEAYQIMGSKLYLVKYTEPGTQKAATPTYVANAKVTEMINSNPNIVASAMQELRARYSDANRNLRNNSINPAVDSSGTEGQDNAKTKMQESITSTKDTRKQYLDGASGTVK